MVESTGRPGLSKDESSAMRRAFDTALSYRENIFDLPAHPVTGLEDAVARFRFPLPEHGQSGDAVIKEIAENADGALHQMVAPSFYGYVCGASHPVGVAADIMVSAWGQNAASAFETPAITGMEMAVCDWLIDLLGLPAECGVGLVTGGTTANMIGVMTARHALFERLNWDVEQDGLFGAPEIPVIIGEQAHSAPLAALRYAGFGAGRVTRVATDQDGSILPEAFARAIRDCSIPPLVILQAGQINTGANDPFAELIPMVREKGGWVHVDGAFGLWLAAVPELAGRLKGVQDADSWAVDLHKWLNAPYDAGAVIVRERPALVASMSARGAYLPDLTSLWEPTDSTPELSRRARGVPSYAIMRHLGKQGIREMINRHCRLAERLADKLGNEPGITVLNRIVGNQVAISIGDDEMTARVLERVQHNQRVYPTHGELNGRKIIRASIIGYAMLEQDVDLLAQEIIAAKRWCEANPQT